MPAHPLVRVSWNAPLRETRFLERPNRFLLRCRDENTGQIVEAHLPDPGRLTDVLLPGRKVWVIPAVANPSHPANQTDPANQPCSANRTDPANQTGLSALKVRPARKTQWTAVLGETGTGLLVSVDATLPNRLAEKALVDPALEEFTGWNLVRKEFPWGASRWDFLLENANGQKLLMEVKSVTLMQNGFGLFPDAVTERGARHVRELAEIAKNGEMQTAVLFIVQREDVQGVRAAEEIDPHFAEALRLAKKAGVWLVARKCRVSFEGVTLSDPVPVLL